MRPYDDDDLALAWAILKDLGDRRGIPDWLGSESDDAAQDVARAVATLIAAGLPNRADEPAAPGENDGAP